MNQPCSPSVAPHDRQHGQDHWYWVGVVTAALILFVQGAFRLGYPSLWHDELVHVFVARSIAQSGIAELPSGREYFSGAAFNYLLAGFIYLWDWSESTVRMPAVLVSTVNVILNFVCLRPLIGRNRALGASFILALCPWTVSWARQARFYALHQTAYLLFIAVSWRLLNARDARSLAMWSVAAIAAYLAGIFTALHSLLFLGAPAAWTALLLFSNKDHRGRNAALLAAFVLVGCLTFAVYLSSLHEVDVQAVYRHSGLGGRMVDQSRAEYHHYVKWLWKNLSVGFFLVAMLGFLGMLRRPFTGPWYAALAFWAPVLTLSFLIGYRRPRFMYFAFPFYAAAVSYGLALIVTFLRGAFKAPWRKAFAALLVLFLLRLGLSGIYLVGDSLEIARGAHRTLARVHPDWRSASQYVNERLTEQDALLSTSGLPLLYYFGRLDAMFPAALYTDTTEVDCLALNDLDDLTAFLQRRPRGFFISHTRRLEVWTRLLPDEIAFIERNMRLIPEACALDINVYRWDESTLDLADLPE